MEDIYHDTLKACTHCGPDFCEPVVAAVEEAKEEAARHMEEQKKKS